MPTLRKWWAEELSRNLRNKKTTVRCAEDRNSVAVFIGREFVSKSSIEYDFDNSSLALRLLRFKEARYQYPGDLKYVSYKIAVSDDSDF